MDIMNLLAEARPSSLDPRPDPARRASDLARAIGAPRAGTGTSRRRLVRRPAPPSARMIAIGTTIAALAGTAGLVVALSFTGGDASRPGRRTRSPGRTRRRWKRRE